MECSGSGGADRLAQLLARGVVTAAQAEECARACGRPDDARAVMTELLARGYLDREELAALGWVEDGPTEGGRGGEHGSTREGLASGAGFASVVAHLQGDLPRANGEAADLPTSLAEGGAVAPPARTFGRFVILGELGRGGMGIVFRAFDPELQRNVALKGLIGNVTGLSDVSAARFRREARTAARLRHPGIIPVHEVGEVDGQAYLVMDLIDGPRLLDHVRDTAMEFAARARLVQQVAEAIAYAHGEGVLHRDLKPDNVLIDAGGRPVVGDFGLAREISDAASSRLTATGVLLGTPAYMAPEQAQGRTADLGTRTDVYGLGGILYHLLADRPPFEAGSLPDLLLRVSTEPPPPPSRYDPRVPRDLEVICLRCLEKDPSRRYGSATELAEDLGRFLAGEPIRARPASMTVRVARWIRLRKGLTAALAVTVVALGAAIAAGIHVDRTRREQARSVLGSRFYQETQLRLTVALERRRRKDVTGLPALLAETVARAEAEAARDPELAAAWFVKGWVLRLDGRIGEAEAALDRAVALRPGDAAARYERGLARAESYRRADEEARRAFARMGPTNAPRPVPRQADLQALRPDLPLLRARAEEDFAALEERIVQGETGLLSLAAVSCGRGLLALYRGDWGSAEALLRRAVGEDRYLDEAWDGLRAVLRHPERQPKATSQELIELLNDALAANEGRAGLWMARAEAYNVRAQDCWRAGREDEAETAWAAADRDGGEAVTLDPRDLEACVVQAELLLDRAISWTRRGRDVESWLARAEEAVARALEGRPDFAAAWRARAAVRETRAQAAALRGTDPRPDLRAAIADGERAVARNDDEAEFRVSLAMTRHDLAREQAARGENPLPDLEAAIRDLDRALADRPNLERAWIARGNAWLGLGDAQAQIGQDPHPAHRRAIADFGEAIRCNPRSAEAYANRGNARRALVTVGVSSADDPFDVFREAIEDYGRALAANPAYEVAYSGRGNAYQQLGDLLQERGQDPRESYRQAIADHAEAWRLSPNDFRPCANRAGASLLLAIAERSRGADPREALESAVADYRRAEELNPASAQLAYNRANALVTLGEADVAAGRDPMPAYESARAAYEEALKRNPRYVLACYALGNATVRMANAAPADTGDRQRLLNQALAEQRRALQLNPAFWRAHWSMAAIYETQGRYAEAVAAYEAVAAQIGPDQPQLREALERARRIAAQGDAREPTWGEWFTLGDRRTRAGDYAAARDAYERGFAAREEARKGLPEPERRKWETDPAFLASTRDAHYNLACCLARASGPGPVADSAALVDAAFRHLREAIRLGFSDFDHLEEDPDLKLLHPDPRWKEWRK